MPLSLPPFLCLDRWTVLFRSQAHKNDCFQLFPTERSQILVENGPKMNQDVYWVHAWSLGQIHMKPILSMCTYLNQMYIF